MFDFKIEVKGQKTFADNTQLLVGNSKNYANAVFTFDSAWDGMVKTAIFRRPGNSESMYQVLTDNQCIIPYQMLLPGGFLVSVVGMLNGTVVTSDVANTDIKTDKLLIPVNQGGYEPGAGTLCILPDVYEQVMNLLLAAQAKSAQAYGSAIKNVSIDGSNNLIVEDMTGKKTNFGNIKGETGPQGIQGIQGPIGEKGEKGDMGETGNTYYYHIAYADDAAGTGFTQTYVDGKAYIGIETSINAAGSTVAEDYVWMRTKGDTGPQGERGIQGIQGVRGEKGEKGDPGTGIGDMTKSVYDTNNSGSVDNADKVNNHTVNSDVPTDAKFTDTIVDITGKANKTTYSEKTLLATTWVNATYSFETDYPVANNDVVIEPSATITSDQYKAWGKAKIVGSSTDNKLTALGTVPTINIPVIMGVTSK